MSASERLLSLWGEVDDLSRAQAVLSWDQETQMPSAGTAQRAKVLSALAGLRHARLVATELQDALAEAEEQSAGADDALLEAQLRLARRELDRVVRVPEALVRAKAEAAALGHERWQAARKASDFALFQGSLRELVRLSREEAAAIAGDDGRPYDALLDAYEPGAREADLEPLFARLRRELGPIVRAVAESGVVVDESVVHGRFPSEAQRAFGRELAQAIGFDFEAGRLDAAAHPFCTSFGPRDVRITWRWMDDDFRSAVFGILHEAGHGMYEQGLPAAWHRTPAGNAYSLGLHESQSRLWENLVGRSRGFWKWALPRFRAHFPDHPPLALDALFRAVNTIRPSLIRVEADEGTYDLHVAVRFELERALFRGDLEVDDLPGAWDDLYEELLGLRPPDAAQGVLQDVHWSMGAFGYFPTYTLGNLINAQLFEAAERDLGPLEPAFARGEFAPLLAWLRERVHGLGGTLDTSEIVARATGAPLSPEAFLRRRRALARAVYGIEVSG